MPGAPAGDGDEVGLGAGEADGDGDGEPLVVAVPPTGEESPDTTVVEPSPFDTVITTCMLNPVSALWIV